MNKSNIIKFILIIVLGVAGFAVGMMLSRSSKTEETTVKEPEVTEVDPEAIVNGIHVRTGFVEDTGMQTVINNCTTCHSAALVTQNRMNKEGWLANIRWMQETQGLWPLGDNEPIILDYLAKNYAPEDKGRRAPLTNVQWYDLKE